MSTTPDTGIEQRRCKAAQASGEGCSMCTCPLCIPLLPSQIILHLTVHLRSVGYHILSFSALTIQVVLTVASRVLSDCWRTKLHYGHIPYNGKFWHG